MLSALASNAKLKPALEVGLYSFPRGSSWLTYGLSAPAPARTHAACQASLPPSLARLPEQAGLSLKLQKHIGALAGMGFCCPSGLHPPRCGQFHSFLLGAASPQRKKPLEPFSFQPVFIEFHLHVFFFSNRSVIYLGL